MQSGTGSMDVSEFLASAEKQGMFAVDGGTADALLKEYDESMVKVDQLCEVVDPETTPFDSKYKARKMLDDLCNKLEATKTIASLEKKRDVMDAMNVKIASIRVKLGTISWECEEPHNAQTDLELAAEHYFPGFVERVLSSSAGSDDDKGDDGAVKPESMDDVRTANLEPPEIECKVDEEIADAMKCLNMLGILWAGRAQVRKSLLYLLAAKSLYYKVSGNTSVLKESHRNDLESTCTHNLFYLAQAYGHVGDMTKSSQFCRETLQRQLAAGLDGDAKIAFDWAKNCAGIADFYQAMEKYHYCAAALASAEKVLHDKVLVKLRATAAAADAASSSSSSAASSSSSSILLADAIELEADICRRWARLDSKILKMAFDADCARRAAMEADMPWAEAVPVDDEEGGFGPLLQVESPRAVATAERATPTATAAATITATTTTAAAGGETNGESVNAQIELFRGLPVNNTPFLRPQDVTAFESARAVFLRAATRIEAAKKVFVLDGFVTDHVNLLQEHSKLYHYLSSFEIDSKRKLAMETRRLEILQSLLGSLNRTAFDVLHKQISYELGETYLALLEVKLDKLRDRSGGEINENNLKKSEMAKCNYYCKGVLAMFAHFTNMYASTDRPRSDACLAPSPMEFDQHSLAILASAGCQDPDESCISAEEVRPFLNAHFMCCRALSKYMNPPSLPAATRSEPLVAALKIYDWLVKYTLTLCARKQLEVGDVFREEYQICQDMVSLLPPKIDRMHYRGEKGLTI